MAKITIADLTAAFASTTALNARFQQIEDALNDLVLYRDISGTPGEPNSMNQDLDMGNNKIINVVNPTEDQQVATKDYVDTIVAAGGVGSPEAIKTLYETNPDTNEFSDAEQTKLAGIEALADVTDATNVDAAGAIMQTDIVDVIGPVQKTGSETFTVTKSNYSASAAPTVNDDSSAGYAINSHWVDLTNDDLYVCVDTTVGAAVWIQAATSTPGGVTSVTGTAPIVSSGGATPTISITAASAGSAGSMSAADFTKLNVSVLGTVEASKAVTADANSLVTFPAGGGLSIPGSSVTASGSSHILEIAAGLGGTEYDFEAHIQVNNAGGGVVHLEINGDTTGTNYYIGDNDGGTPTASNTVTAPLDNVGYGKFIGKIFISNSRVYAIYTQFYKATTGIVTKSTMTTIWNETTSMSAINSVRFIETVGSRNFHTNSYLKLRRIR